MTAGWAQPYPSSDEVNAIGTDPQLTPWPALNDTLDLVCGVGRFAVLAIPWEPGGETAFHIAQCAAKNGANPLCMFPSWSPHWDGTLTVRRTHELSQDIDYTSLVSEGAETGMVILDQFSRLHWGNVTSHDEREDVACRAGIQLLNLSRLAEIPVLVIVRRKKTPHMTISDLRSDGALEYDCDALVMVDPDHTTGTATLNVVKNRRGPTGTATVEWEALPRTVHRRSP